ncbi:MAG: hypothetical protein RIQ47_714 [Bacteroidota bacterium]
MRTIYFSMSAGKNLSLFLFALLFGCQILHAETQAALVTPIVVAPIDSMIDECSGLDYTGGTHFWAHNDGYGDNTLYRISNSGVYTRSLVISNATNYDWEDLTHDEGRNYLFIGDFGNNSCGRTNLRIYRITYPLLTSPASVTADEIQFSYPDQTLFPSPWYNFDAEAFFHHNGNFYIFSKADSSAIGYTKLYRVPDQPGTHVAMLIDSFYTNDRITSAAMNDDSSAVVLLANNRIHLFTGWTGDNFFTGNYTMLRFSTSWTQKEAITFYTRTTVWMADESDGVSNFLYRVDLSAYIPPPATTGIMELVVPEVRVYPNPASEELTVCIPNLMSRVDYSLTDMTGKKVHFGSSINDDSFGIDVHALPSGIYQLHLTGGDFLPCVKRVVVSH